MSLILEALRKLEREKHTPERGFLVLGPGSWAERGVIGRPIALFGLGLLVGAVALGLAMRVRSAPAAPASTRAALEAPTVAAPTPPAMPPATTQAPAPASLASSPPAPAAKSAAPAFTLQAISEKDGHPVALINDHLLREGDAIEGAHVVRIATDNVELEIGGRRVVLRF